MKNLDEALPIDTVVSFLCILHLEGEGLKGHERSFRDEHSQKTAFQFFHSARV